MAKSVKVHDDTHRALMELKASRRSRSVDEVVREMIRVTTGKSVDAGRTDEGENLTSYLGE